MNKITLDSVKNKIRKIACDICGVDPETFTGGKTFENIGMDLLDVTELEIGLETEYGIYIYDNIEPEMTLDKTAEEVFEIVKKAL